MIWQGFLISQPISFLLLPYISPKSNDVNMGEKALSTYTYEEYLAIEASSELKHEYHDGFITFMAGGTLAHGQIAMNMGRQLGNVLESKNRNCITYSSDVKVHIASSSRTYYPGISVVCEKPQTSEKDSHALTNPILIVEVLSESTADFDRGEKFAHYRQLPSLREYMLISQISPMVDIFFRTDDGTWDIHTYTELSEFIHLQSLECEIPMKDIYRLVPEIGVENS